MKRRKFIGNLSLAALALSTAPLKSIASSYSASPELSSLPQIRHGLMQFSGIAKSGSELTRFYKNGYPDNNKSNIIAQLSFAVQEEFGTYNFQISIEEGAICLLGPRGFEQIVVPETTQTLFADEAILLELRKVGRSEKLNFKKESLIDCRAICFSTLEEVDLNSLIAYNAKKQAHLNDGLLLFILKRNIV